MFKEDFHTQILGPVWFLAKFLTTLVEEKEKEGRKRESSVHFSKIEQVTLKPVIKICRCYEIIAPFV